MGSNGLPARGNGIPAGAADGNVRVLIVDDHELFRHGLREMLEEHGITVAAEAADGEEAVRQVAELSPDVVIMDLKMPGMSGVEATRLITAASPPIRVLALTVSPDEEDVVAAVLAGACGYLIKDAAPEEILAAVGATLDGGSPLSPRIARRLIRRVRREAALQAPVPDPELTERELDVLRLMAAGKGNGEIASKLFISKQTVKNHVSSVLDKLGVDNRVQAAVYAVRWRLL